MRLTNALNRALTLTALAATATLAVTSCGESARPDQWPDGGNEAKPRSRWWWMGSAVDTANIRQLVEQYAEAGLGGLEICPIYGVKGNDSIDIPFLSEKWMEMYAFALEETKRHDMALDFTCGTGWPFGGPNISEHDAAQRLHMVKRKLNIATDGETQTCRINIADARRAKGAHLVELFAFATDGRKATLKEMVNGDTLQWVNAPAGNWQLFALWQGPTYQAVKRAAPGGEGLVMNYFDRSSVEHYLSRFDSAFAKANMKFPGQMFSDSYEVYGADFTHDMFDAFAKQHGYRLEDYIPHLISRENNDTTRRLRSDYCETIDSLLQTNFLKTWNDWLHANGSTSREQAHGSVANVLDLYATSDIPEAETYGRAKAQIRNLAVPDTFQRKNESDKSIMKFASSGAHVAGKRFTSSETLTWASEHFRMTPAVCKPEIDAVILSGINKIYYHGTTYSPVDAEWPGWKFYASVDYSPTNVFWPELKSLNRYVWRIQSFMQAGESDADVLLYFPIFDIWNEQNSHFVSFSIEHLQVYAAEFLKLSNEVEHAGYMTDYISDRQIKGLSVKNGMLVTAAGVRYKTMVLPSVEFMHADVLAHVKSLIEDGATIVFTDSYPTKAPGLECDAEQKAIDAIVASMPAFVADGVKVSELGDGKVVTSSCAVSALAESGTNLTCESLTKENGLRYLRRRNADGYTYFIANMDLADVDAKSVKLGVEFADAVIYEPLTGLIGRAATDAEGGVRIQLESGETAILRTYDRKVEVPEWKYRPTGERRSVTVDRGWSIRFAESVPAIDGDKVFETDTLTWWTSLPDSVCQRNSGVAVYSATFELPAGATNAVLRLDNVKYAADISINGRDAQSMWSFPYVTDISHLVREGSNTIAISVRGSAANRIAQMDRDGIVWRKFKDTNLLDVKGKVRDYAWWPIDTQGMAGPVTIEFD